jgi:hypothetical protein
LARQVTTERMIRQQLQEQTGVDVSDRKAFIKEQVRRKLQPRCQPDQGHDADPSE